MCDTIPGPRVVRACIMVTAILAGCVGRITESSEQVHVRIAGHDLPTGKAETTRTISGGLVTIIPIEQNQPGRIALGIYHPSVPGTYEVKTPKDPGEVPDTRLPAFAIVKLGGEGGVIRADAHGSIAVARVDDQIELEFTGTFTNGDRVSGRVLTRPAPGP